MNSCDWFSKQKINNSKHIPNPKDTSRHQVLIFLSFFSIDFNFFINENSREYFFLYTGDFLPNSGEKHEEYNFNEF